MPEMGKAIGWDDADLDRLSEIDEAAIVRAKGWWRRRASPRFRSILDAREEGDGVAEADPDRGGAKEPVAGPDEPGDPG